MEELQLGHIYTDTVGWALGRHAEYPANPALCKLKIVR